MFVYVCSKTPSCCLVGCPPVFLSRKSVCFARIVKFLWGLVFSLRR
ncbi:hypothetical protein Nmel_005316 [Mimus melanotis]